MIRHSPPLPRLPVVPEEEAPVLNIEGEKPILLVGGIARILDERAGRKLMEDLKKFYEKENR